MLFKDDVIVTAYAEPAAGPGWSNRPVWVIVRRDGVLLQECLQPEEQTPEIALLYRVSLAAHEAMARAVADALQRRKKRKAP